MNGVPTPIAGLLDRWAEALRNKDLEALRACYADDVAVYDIGSHIVGFDKLAGLWASCFPYFKEPIEVERKNVHATVGDDVIAMSFLSRVSGHGENDPAANSWYRCTMCFHRSADGWKITQEHSSVAFDFLRNELALILDET